MPLKIDRIFSTHGNPVDFDIFGKTLFVAEDIVGFSIYNINSGNKLHHINESQSAALEKTPLIKYIPPSKALLVNDRTSSQSIIVYSFDESSGELTYKNTITGGASSVNDIQYEILSSDAVNTRIYWGYYHSTNGNQIGYGAINNNTNTYTYGPSANVPNSVWNIYLYNDYIITANGQRGIFFTNKNLSFSNEFNTPGNARSLAIKDNILFVGCTNSGLKLVDISDINAPVLLPDNFQQIANARSVSISGNYLAVGSTNSGLYLYDIKNSISPKLIDIISFERIGYINKVKFYNRRLYVASQKLGVIQISIL
jgi:hypothetical protein